MAKYPDLKNLYRVIDANINRSKEGLRVCEEVCRFMLNDKPLTAALKKARHRVDGLTRSLRKDPQLMEQRDSLGDVGLRVRNRSEFIRKDCGDIFSANLQRVKESVRVLEEFSKLDDVKTALGFRKLRYELYELEKKAAGKLPALRHNKPSVL